MTGLDYSVARCYDPVVGQFLSADTVQGNAQGTSPYAYVEGNPETRIDPTGQRWIGGNGETAWINPGNGNIYVEQPGSLPKVIGHVNIRPPSSTSSTPHTPSRPKSPPPPKPKLPTKPQIHKAQSIAAFTAAKFAAEGAAMLAIAAFLPEVVAALETIATNLEIAAGAALAVLNWIAAPILFALSLAFTALAAYVAKSAVTLTIGGAASLMLGALFAGRAQDDNANDWTPAAVDQFGQQVQNFTLAIKLATGVISFINGNGIVRKLIGAAVNVSTTTYAFVSLDNDIAQMKAAVSA